MQWISLQFLLTQKDLEFKPRFPVISKCNHFRDLKIERNKYVKSLLNNVHFKD